jgi:hypothetical protein
MTDSEILLSINTILSKYTTKVVKAGPKVDKIRIISNQRAEDQNNISNQLKVRKINFKNEIDKSESSFPVTKIDLPKSSSIIKLIYKKTSGGGSGAGAALTKLTESAQALYAALVFNVLKREMTIADVTKDNFLKASATTSIDYPIQNIMNDLPDDWINSSILGANTLYKNFKGKGDFTFHRGSKEVSLIESTFTRINKDEKAFGNLNKWSPADIYMIKNRLNLNEISTQRSLKGLNAKMYDYIINNQLIGVSLKKMYGTANLSKKNFSSDKSINKAKFYGITSNIDSIDGYIKWGTQNSEKIQFRAFGGETSLTGWQGEIKGTSANQGKISLGPINFILKRYNLPQLPTSLQSATLAQKNTIEHCREIANLMVSNRIVSPQQVEEVATLIQNNKSNKYRYSKYLVMKLFQIINSVPDDIKNKIVQDFYLYASSQASYSSPYYKLE